MQPRFPVTAIALIAMLLPSTAARADFFFKFADSSGTVSTSFNLDFSQSQTLDIQVLLVATGSDANTLRTEGLSSYGVEVEYNGTIADVQSMSDILNNDSAFEGTNAFNAVTSGNVTNDSARSLDSTSSAETGTQVGSEQRVLLTTLRFTGIANATTATVTVDPFDGFSNTVLGNGTIIDGAIFNTSATITVTNVPEPSSMILTALAGFGMAGGVVRRIRNRQKQA